MAVKIRLARAGSKGRPYFHIVVANSRAPRDGKFIEEIGTYNPLLSDAHPDRIRLNQERVAYWLSVGAEPTERVEKFIAKLKA